MLPEFADMGAAETPLSARFAPGLRSRSHDRAYDHRKPSGGPPRVDRAVMLPEFADMGAPEKPASARFAPGPLTRLASSTAPVALRQSRILRTTRHVLH
jgi:hypothetical protein